MTTAEANHPAPVILDDAALAEIEARANAATPGEWAVWDSCSWRRIGTREPFADGNVICPVTQNDGHPDLLAKREDLEFVVSARTDIPALCATVRALRRQYEGAVSDFAVEINALREQLAETQQLYASTREALSFSSSERERQLESRLAQVEKERDDYRERLLQTTETEVEI